MSEHNNDEVKINASNAALSVEMLEAELKREQYKNKYSRVLRSTLFSLLVVVAAAVLVVILVLPVLQSNGTSMTETLQDGDIVVAMNGSKFETGDLVAFYYNNNFLVKKAAGSYPAAPCRLKRKTKGGAPCRIIKTPVMARISTGS